MPNRANLESRLEKLEATLDRLVDLVERSQSPFAGANRQAQHALTEIYGEAEVRERMGELVLRLGEPETLEAVTRIGVMLPQIEYAVNALAAGPELLEEGLEMARDKMEAEGLDAADTQQRLDAATEALNALSRKEALQAMKRLGESLPHVAPFLDAAARTGRDLAEVEGTDALTDRISESLLRIIEPEALDALTRVAAMTPQLEYAVTALTAGPEVLEEVMETVRHGAEKNGRDPNEMARLTQSALDALSKLSDPKVTQALDRLDPAALVELTSTASEPETKEALLKLVKLAPQLEPPLSALPVQPHTLELLRTLNESVESELTSEPRSIGVFGGLRALSDRRVQRALGLAVAVAERLGERLEQAPMLPPRTGG
jgi:uncharacterized protein YjgD (DUF1641 family)